MAEGQLEGSDPDFTIEVEIDVALPALHAFLCDLHRYVPLHPFIESIEELPPHPDYPDARHYRVVDRIPLLPFAAGPLRLDRWKVKTVYTAALDPVGPNEVRGHAWQSPGIRLVTVYRLEPTSGGTRLIERCHVRAGRLLRRFVVSQARKAHRETLAGMKRLIEGEEPIGGASA